MTRNSKAARQGGPATTASSTPTVAAGSDRWPNPGRLWGAFMLARSVDACSSILRGLPVRVGNLDRFVLRRALRGGRLPDEEAYRLVDGEMLDAVAEAGPIPERPMRSDDESGARVWRSRGRQADRARAGEAV
jgi:hypothetical protein